MRTSMCPRSPPGATVISFGATSTVGPGWNRPRLGHSSRGAVESSHFSMWQLHDFTKSFLYNRPTLGPMGGANRLVWRAGPAGAVRLLAMVGLALGLIALSAIAAQASGDESPTYQIDTSHSGAQPTDGLRAPLGQVWSRDLGGAVSYALIEGGRAYVTVADTGTNGTRLFALDLAT